MNRRTLIFLMLILSASLCDIYAKRYVGGDISLLPEYEKAGAQYKDHDGAPVSDVLSFFHTAGMNAMRVRLFVNPADYTASDADPNACQDLEYIIPLCRRIKDAGFALMLDFHYSDTWADPAKQWTPKVWQGLSDDELYAKIHEYTAETLTALNEAGATPDFIQTGNEISFGMLWGSKDAPESDLKKVIPDNPANWARFATLLKEAVSACREKCPQAAIVLHNERVSQPYTLRYFYDKMQEYGVDYDIIGLSYYPYFHGPMSVLRTALDMLSQDFSEKEIMIVETGYSYKWEVPGTNQKVDYPYSDAGQNAFARDLVSTLEGYERVNGLFWWWMEYNAYGTSLSGWYNASLFDSTTGRVGSALKTICGFASDSGVESVVGADGEEEIFYDLSGRRVGIGEKPGILVSRRRKVISR